MRELGDEDSCDCDDRGVDLQHGDVEEAVDKLGGVHGREDFVGSVIKVSELRKEGTERLEVLRRMRVRSGLKKLAVEAEDHEQELGPVFGKHLLKGLKVAVSSMLSFASTPVT